MKKLKETVLIIEGMHCTNCALGIKKQLEKSGLQEVDVNFTTGEVHFSYDEKEQVQAAINTINAMGYHVTTGLSEKENKTKKRLSSIEVKFYFSLVFTIPLLSAMFLPFEFLHQPLFQLFLCIPVYTVGMRHFGKSAFYSLRSGVPNMDVLITLGSSAAFFYSLTGTILGLGHDYQFYETPASIISLIFLGNMLEHWIHISKLTRISSVHLPGSICTVGMSAPIQWLDAPHPLLLLAISQAPKPSIPSSPAVVRSLDVLNAPCCLPTSKLPRALSFAIPSCGTAASLKKAQSLTT